MNRPHRFLVRMMIFLAIVAGICFLLQGPLLQAFFYNPFLNGLLGGVLLLGTGVNFRQVLMLNPEITWIKGFRSDRLVASTSPLRLLAPMAAMIGEKQGGRLSLSAMATRSLLDGIAARLEESRDLSRYLIGLMIFLGLLGTFWGLLDTVNAVSGVIAALNTQTDVSNLFNDLQAGLKAPLSGMGTAFGTSLIGLAGSLVIGFLDLQAGQAQNRFYNELEDWLAGLTRVGGSGLSADGDQSVPAYIQALLETTADNLDNLQRTMQKAEEGRQAANVALTGLGDRLAQLAEQSRTEQQLMARLAEAQLDMKPALLRFVEAASRAGGGSDDAVRGSLRNIEGLMAKLVEESQTGRTQMTQDLRNEIRLLARTIAALAEEERQTG